MSDLDAYSLCPCGSGKQIKFCGSRDLLPQLSRIAKSIGGKQIASATDQARQALEAHPGRECLLSLYAQLELANKNYDAAEKAIQTFTDAHPSNVNAWAMAATVQGTRNGVVFAIEPLQKALELSEKEWTPLLYQAVRMAAELLSADADTFAAAAYLGMAAMASGKEDVELLIMFDRMNKSSQASLLLKQPLLVESNEDSPWQEALEFIWQEAYQGRWLSALGMLNELLRKHPEAPNVIQSIAILHGWLCDRPAMAKTLRSLAALEAASLSLRVEAEAMARIVDPNFQANTLDIACRTFSLKEGDAALEKFTTDPQLVRMPIDLNTLGDEDNPSPRGAYWLLDRPLAESDKESDAADLPSIVAEIYLFGRETDRAARAEMNYVHDERAAEVVQSFEAILADLQEGKSAEKNVGQIEEVKHVLTVSAFVPFDMPRETSRSLIAKEKQNCYFKKWTELALPELGGKTPRQASGDPSQQIALLASLLLLELEEEKQGSEIDFNALRKELGLPISKPLSGNDGNAFNLPLARLRWIDYAKLDDEGLAAIFSRSRSFSAVKAGQLASEEIIARGGIGEGELRIEAEDAYSLLATLSHDQDQSLEYYDKGRQAAIESGRSPANWLLRELELRIVRNERERASEILQQVQQNHIEEPGISDLLWSLLDHLGVQINQQPAAAQPAPAATPSGLWTPGSEAPAETAAEEKEPSKLWVPGMD